MTDEQIAHVCDSVQEVLAGISAGTDTRTKQFSAAAGSSH
jgi:hypothetical protein